MVITIFIIGVPRCDVRYWRQNNRSENNYTSISTLFTMNPGADISTLDNNFPSLASFLSHIFIDINVCVG